MKFSIKNFFSKYDQIRSFLRIWSNLLKKYLMKNFILRAVSEKLAYQINNKNSEMLIKESCDWIG